MESAIDYVCHFRGVGTGRIGGQMVVPPPPPPPIILSIILLYQSYCSQNAVLMMAMNSQFVKYHITVSYSFTHTNN